jgi:hypothetical protein
LDTNIRHKNKQFLSLELSLSLKLGNTQMSAKEETDTTTATTSTQLWANTIGDGPVNNHHHHNDNHNHNNNNETKKQTTMEEVAQGSSSTQFLSDSSDIDEGEEEEEEDPHFYETALASSNNNTATISTSSTAGGEGGAGGSGSGTLSRDNSATYYSLSDYEVGSGNSLSLSSLQKQQQQQQQQQQLQQSAGESSSEPLSHNPPVKSSLDPVAENTAAAAGAAAAAATLLLLGAGTGPGNSPTTTTSTTKTKRHDANLSQVGGGGGGEGVASSSHVPEVRRPRVTGMPIYDPSDFTSDEDEEEDEEEDDDDNNDNDQQGALPPPLSSSSSQPTSTSTSSHQQQQQQQPLEHNDDNDNQGSIGEGDDDIDDGGVIVSDDSGFDIHVTIHERDDDDLDIDDIDDHDDHDDDDDDCLDREPTTNDLYLAMVRNSGRTFSAESTISSKPSTRQLGVGVGGGYQQGFNPDDFDSDEDEDEDKDLEKNDNKQARRTTPDYQSQEWNSDSSHTADDEEGDEELLHSQHVPNTTSQSTSSKKKATTKADQDTTKNAATATTDDEEEEEDDGDDNDGLDFHSSHRALPRVERTPEDYQRIFEESLQQSMMMRGIDLGNDDDENDDDKELSQDFYDYEEYVELRQGDGPHRREPISPPSSPRGKAANATNAAATTTASSSYADDRSGEGISIDTYSPTEHSKNFVQHSLKSSMNDLTIDTYTDAPKERSSSTNNNKDGSGEPQVSPLSSPQQQRHRRPSRSMDLANWAGGNSLAHMIEEFDSDDDEEDDDEDMVETQHVKDNDKEEDRSGTKNHESFALGTNENEDQLPQHAVGDEPLDFSPVLYKPRKMVDQRIDMNDSDQGLVDDNEEEGGSASDNHDGDNDRDHQEGDSREEEQEEEGVATKDEPDVEKGATWEEGYEPAENDRGHQDDKVHGEEEDDGGDDHDYDYDEKSDGAYVQLPPLLHQARGLKIDENDKDDLVVAPAEQLHNAPPSSPGMENVNPDYYENEDDEKTAEDGDDQNDEEDDDGENDDVDGDEQDRDNDDGDDEEDGYTGKGVDSSDEYDNNLYESGVYSTSDLVMESERSMFGTRSTDDEDGESDEEDLYDDSSYRSGGMSTVGEETRSELDLMSENYSPNSKNRSANSVGGGFQGESQLSNRSDSSSKTLISVETVTSERSLFLESLSSPSNKKKNQNNASDESFDLFGIAAMSNKNNYQTNESEGSFDFFGNASASNKKSGNQSLYALGKGGDSQNMNTNNKGQPLDRLDEDGDEIGSNYGSDDLPTPPTSEYLREMREQQKGDRYSDNGYESSYNHGDARSQRSNVGETVVIEETFIDEHVDEGETPEDKEKKQRTIFWCLAVICCFCLIFDIALLLVYIVRNFGIDRSEPEIPFLEPSRVVARVPQTICLEYIPNQPRNAACASDTSRLRRTRTLQEQEGAIGDILARAVWNVTLAPDYRGAPVDLALIHAGMAQTDIQAGDFTVEDAMNLLGTQFDDHSLVVVDMTGRQIEQVLEQALEMALGFDKADLSSSYPYGAGINFDVNVATDTTDRALRISILQPDNGGSRRSMLRQSRRSSQRGNSRHLQNDDNNGEWVSLNLEETYTVITTQHLIQGGEGYLELASLINDGVWLQHPKALEALVRYVEWKKVLEEPVMGSTREFVTVNVPTSEVSSTTAPTIMVNTSMSETRPTSVPATMNNNSTNTTASPTAAASSSPVSPPPAASSSSNDTQPGQAAPPTAAPTFTENIFNNSTTPVGETSRPTAAPTASNRYLAWIPRDICYEWIPGQGKSSVCSAESTLSQGGGVNNLVAWAMYDQIPDVEIALWHAGDCQSDIYYGNFTVADAKRVIPETEDTVVFFDMTGTQLATVLEQAIDMALSNDPGDQGPGSAYPYTAGLRFSVNATSNPTTGSHVWNHEVLTDGSWVPLDMGRTYRVITTGYLASGNAGYTEFLQSTLINSDNIMAPPKTIQEIFIETAEAWGVLTDPPPESYSTKEFLWE